MIKMGVFTKLKELVNKDKDQPQFFLALNIDQNSVEACVWGVVEGQTRILGTAAETYQGFGNLSFSTGQAIDLAGEEARVDVSQTIFGLPEDWIDQDKVNEPYAHALKNLAKDLELEPLAFVSTPKAIAHLLFSEEQAPINAIIVGLSQETITASLVVNGKIISSKVVGIVTANVTEEIVKVLDSLPSNQPLPSRIVLYGSTDLVPIRDQLASFAWPAPEERQVDSAVQSTAGYANFLHPPKIERLGKGSQGKAVALAGATDLGFSKPTALVSPSAPTTKPAEATPTDTNFGFVQGRDILKETREDQVQQSTVVDQTINRQEAKNKRSGQAIIFINKILQAISLRLSARRNLIALPLIGLVLIFLVLFALYWFLPKAKVELFVQARPLSQEAQIIASPQLSTVSEEKGQIPAQVLETVQKGSQKAVTSGKKLVGDKAIGKVTIFNKTAAPRTFDVGTVITASSSKLKFTLGLPTTVASRSATLEGITYGKAEAAVTAQAIGSDSNIAAGLDFTIADFDQSLYSAHNDQAFSGGTSRETTVVSEDDLRRLEETLTADLLSKAKADLSSKIAVNQKLSDQAIFKSIISKNYDKKTGDESAVVTLNLEVKFKVTTYNEDDLKKVLLGYMKVNIPDGFELVESNVKTDTSVSKVAENGDLIFNAKLQATLIPKLDIKQIQNNLAGKKPQAVESYLASLPEVIGSEIKLQPPLPGPLSVLPRVANRINIVISPR